MSTPFTAVTSTHLQDLALFHEILLAFYERLAATDPSVTIPADLSTVWPAGTNAQAATLYYNQQAWLQGHYGSFLDPEVTIAGAAALPVLTLARWRELAGLHPDGFRRVAGNAWPADWTDLDDPAYSYGYVAAGDILGPWLLDDLQRAYSALTIAWRGPPSSDWTANGYKSIYREWASWAAMQADPTFAGGEESNAADGQQFYRLLKHEGTTWGIFYRSRFTSPMHPCRPRTQTLYFLQSDTSEWVVDGLGDYPLVSGQLYPVATQGPDTLQFVCDAPASLAFTPPSDPGLYFSAGYLPLARLVAAYDFTNA